MKLFFAFCLAGLALAQCAPSKDITFEEFKAIYGKQYSPDEDVIRRNVFYNNLKWIRENNGKNGVELDINQYADMTQDDFSNLYKKINVEEYLTSDLLTHVTETEFEVTDDLPHEFLWDKKINLTVKNQGSCGSCWAFASVSTIEGAYAINLKEHVVLSPQQLVDCDTSEYGSRNQGCSGGFPPEAFEYVQEEGIVEEAFYHYRGLDERCNQASLRHHRYHINGYGTLPFMADDKSLMTVLKNHGPIVVLIYAHHDTFRFYKHGIMSNVFPNSRIITHAVTLVGWGIEGNQAYWKILNSWGKSWGEGGYGRIGRGHNWMGMNNYVSYPKLN